MIDYKTESLMDKARRKKERNKRRQRTLYEKGKKQGGKYTHDINAKGNTVSNATLRKASPQRRKELEEAERKRWRKLQEKIDRGKRKEIWEKIKQMKLQKRRNK